MKYKHCGYNLDWSHTGRTKLWILLDIYTNEVISHQTFQGNYQFLKIGRSSPFFELR